MECLSVHVFGSVFASAWVWECSPVHVFGSVCGCTFLGMFASEFWECLRVHFGSVCECIFGVYASAVHFGSVCECILGVFAA